ncbi:phosphoenolpyruvate--protein phosphotransferase [Candidatus Haliotispira prima]|uniref:Phosphoenolpyruvate-protein phosphotransferase n=1 Tax=Candidatus Haliotispira prima TaxID=3034016 RepID=A0ABY8ME54_9SPIO|nr:phosphoenolpyruvate--protein phosphotransferase [Candidatus Haliotispira prima]
MIEVQGMPAAPGIGIGKLCFAPHRKRSIPEYSINKGDVASELERLCKAIELVDEELLLLHKSLGDSDVEKVDFITAHRMILQDPILKDTMETWLHEKLNNVESLLLHFTTGMEQHFRGMDNPMFAERSKDIQDVAHRVIDALLGYKRDDSLSKIKEDCVIVAHDLYPSDTVTLNFRHVKGLVTETGGVTSHTAIMVRAFGIPAVLGVENLLRNFHRESFSDPCLVVIDGNKGKAFLDPDKRTLASYYSLKKQRSAHFDTYLNALRPKVSTKDGQDVYLYTNMGILDELESPLLPSSSGIGLFRSEFLFPEKIPTEEEQYQAYIKILTSVSSSQEVTIRTTDFGGDKVPGIGLFAEDNPLLGCRAIRLAMAYPEELFRPQIRAIYRAAAYGARHGLGKMRVMLPMISTHGELLRARDLIDETLKDLKTEVPEIPIGAMIELPSAVLCSDIIAKSVDFFSIGTNDLVQYTLGVDRVNEKVAHLYDPLQFGVLKLIRITIANANRAGIPVSMCGEMAGASCATAILLGLGLRHFSMASYGLPEIAHAICNYDIEECQEFAELYLSMRDSDTAREYLLEWHKERNITLDIPGWGERGSRNSRRF